jgi:AraC-like DNA-binding protein
MAKLTSERLMADKKTNTKKIPHWHHLPVPIIFPQTYLDIAKERHANIHRILELSEFPVERLKHHHAEINFQQMIQLVKCTIDELGNHGLGIEVGLRLPPTAFGNLGYAILCSATMQDVVTLCMRYWHLLGRGITVSHALNGDIYVVDLTAIPSPEPMQALMCESTVASFYRGFKVLVQAEDQDMEIWLTIDEPVYAEHVRSKISCIRYGMPSNQFRFKAHLLQKSLTMHNPTGLKFALEQCELEEALLKNTGFRLRENVQQLMVFGVNGYPSLQSLSEQLNMTSRTLRRRLEDEGTNFKHLLEEAKRRDAIKLLDDRNKEIQHIASLLGYQDPANFTRAFRQWTGQTPSQYRTMRKIG